MSTTMKAILAVIVLAVVLYGGYRVYHHMSYKAPASTTPVVTTAPSTSASPQTMMNSVYKMMAMKSGSGSYLTDEKGMTLYVYSKDTAGVSNCTGVCIKNWPAYGPTTPPTASELPKGITAFKRADGTWQYAWNGMPLYFWTGDKAAGDVTGEGVNGFSVAK